MRKLAHVIYDYNHRVNLSPTSGARLVAVQELDTHLATLLDFCPLLKWSDSENTPAFHSTYLYWARFTWAWRIPAYRMKLHSIFIGLGRRDDRFRASEDVSVDLCSQLTLVDLQGLCDRDAESRKREPDPSKLPERLVSDFGDRRSQQQANDP